MFPCWRDMSDIYQTDVSIPPARDVQGWRFNGYIRSGNVTREDEATE